MGVCQNSEPKGFWRSVYIPFLGMVSLNLFSERFIILSWGGFDSTGELNSGTTGGFRGAVDAASCGLLAGRVVSRLTLGAAADLNVRFPEAQLSFPVLRGDTQERRCPGLRSAPTTAAPPRLLPGNPFFPFLRLHLMASSSNAASVHHPEGFSSPVSVGWSPCPRSRWTGRCDRSSIGPDGAEC